MKISRSLSSISLYTESVGICGIVFTIGITNVFDGEGTIHSTGATVSGTGGVAIGILSSVPTAGFDLERDVGFGLRLLEVTGAIGSIGLGLGNFSSGLGLSSSGAMSGRAGLPGTGVDEAVVLGVKCSTAVGFGTCEVSPILPGIKSKSKETFGFPFSRYWLT